MASCIGTLTAAQSRVIRPDAAFHHTACPPLLRRGRMQVARSRGILQVSNESSSALKKPDLAVKETDSEPESTGSHSPSPAASKSSSKPAVTIREQREAAKAMTQYFRDLNAAKNAEKAKVFGWTRANEITNGRWVMFGVFVGLLTEYSTGVDFVNQLKLMVSYLGIADIYD